MNYNNKNFLGCKQDILDLEKKIKIIQKDDTILSNFGKLIDFILNQLHKELNRKQKLNTNAPKGDYDEIISYITFKKWFSEQNESIIQKYFFGIIERIELYNCCGLKKYNFDLFKYLFFNTDKDKKEGSIDLQYLINNMENSPIIFKNNCSMCCITSKALVQQRFFDNPIILIIIINNKKKKQINFSENIHTKKYEYKLLCYVTEPENKMDFKIFNIFYIENKKWSVIKTNDDIISKIVGNEIDSLSNYPCILFYERRNLIKKSSKLGNSIGSNSNYNPFYNSNNFIKANNNINGSQQIILNNINLTKSFGSNHTHNLPIAFNNNLLINNHLTNNNNINNTNILNSPNGIDNINDEGEEIILFFVFSNGKEIYLDVKESYSFNEVIKELLKKYDFLNNIKNLLNYEFNGIIIDHTKTVKEIGLKDNSKIKVKLK